jgi:hypothetical protein
MRSNRWTGVVALTGLLIGLLAFWNSTSPGQAPRRNPPMPWEYRVMNAESQENHEEMLNKLGLEGWELVTVNHRSPNSSTNFVLKRPK